MRPKMTVMWKPKTLEKHDPRKCLLFLASDAILEAQQAKEAAFRLRGRKAAKSRQGLVLKKHPEFLLVVECKIRVFSFVETWAFAIGGRYF
jgi:hypothetical protein